jgi:hypothetical protein
MFSKISSSGLAALALLGSVHAHVTMNTPIPYGFDTLTSSPLNGENIQFPCASGGRANAFDATGANNPAVQAGGSQKVAFTGSAVHGGGVCQFSVTYDFPPPKDKSKWRVIHTIIGGCPAQTAGNLQSGPADAQGRPTGPECNNDSGTDCVRSFNVPIPKQLKSGKATFAWTWFNHLGNREMYMNCAPLEITGGSNDDSFFNSLPQMFVANIPGECTTGQGILDIPNPGQSVIKNDSPDSGSLGTCPANGSGNAGGSPAGGASSAAPPAYTSAPAAPTGGVFAPGAGQSSAGGDVATSFTTLTVTPTGAPAASTPAANPPASAPSSPATGGGQGGAGKVSCPTDGAIVCMSETQFGLCDHGFAVPMAVSAGTKCENGAIVKRTAGVRRSRIHRRLHGSS